MKKYLWIHFDAVKLIKGDNDRFKLTPDDFWYGTEEELEEMARDSSQWHQFKEVDERLA